MTIDKEQLISLLEEKTGLEREQVETQLSELISRIQKASEEGKAFEVEGFGTFSMEEESLEFEPGDTLETEINNKYAGMKPIELIGAFKEPENDREVPEVDMTEAEPEGVDTENKWAFDSDATQEENEEQETEAVEPESEPQDDEPEFEPESEKDTEQEEIASDQQKAEEVFDAVFGKTAGEDPEKEVPQKDPEPEEPVAETEEEPQGDTIGTVIVAVVVILVVGIGGWMIYDFGFTGTNSTEISTASPQSTETVKPADGSNTQTDEEPGQDEEVMEPEQPSAVSTEGEDTGTQPATQQQNRYGLMGEPNQDIANGYTIVVHSLRDQQQAEQNRQQLQEAGFRALISQAQVEGTTYYRVGIGQFETVSDAQQAIGDIPQRYQDNNFIKRIQ